MHRATAQTARHDGAVSTRIGPDDAEAMLVNARRMTGGGAGMDGSTLFVLGASR